MLDSPALAALLRSRAALLALRAPLSWVNVATGAPIVIDGQTLDARTQWLLTVFEKSKRPEIHGLPLRDARIQFDTYMKALSASLLPMGMGDPPIGEIVDRTIPGPAGALPIRLYRPADAAASRLPAILFLHGGSWTLGSLDAYDLPCRFLATTAGCLVMAVDYRLAPEHRFPAAVDDSLAAWRWLAANAEAIGALPRRLVVAGDAAGGTLAAVVAQQTRGEATPPALQLLLYPILDLAMSTRSYELFGEGFLTTRRSMEWTRAQYLDDPLDVDDPRVSPLRADDLAGQPPALIYTAGFDIVRDEGAIYAEKLRAAGVRVVYRNFDSLIHGFVGMRGALQAAARAMDDVVAGLRHELAQLG
ncbi:alpha/beta hydrolase [Vineibacter terrae]|uniref:alpha/beta hydrolase n=1 Tax=Vineibacter terrae TaxID=2586908 RepID=UPI002E33FA1D|nr:alpha/beta hydrolase [Vineibacter terrae]HEX2885087.1 alpha/beta hydrolase [Vineibacter terrae]